MSPDISFSTESRPSKRVAKTTIATASRTTDGGPLGSKGDPLEAEVASVLPTAHEGRPSPEDGWTTVRRIEVNERTLRSVKQNLDLKRDAQPDIFQVKAAVPALFIGMEASGRRPVLTDKNPHVEGLLDAHRCVYLPSAGEKAYQLTSTAASQNVFFLELPSAPLFAPGVGMRTYHQNVQYRIE